MKTIQILILTALALFLASCQKYLDVKTNSSQVFLTTAVQCQELLDNTNNMNAGYPSDQEASTDDYYLSDANFTQQAGEDQNIYIWLTNGYRKGPTTWSNLYYEVEQANLVLQALPTIKDGTPQATLDMVKAEALFYRSYAFWWLAQLYCKPYIAASAATDPGIPIRLTADINAVSTRGTVQQTYDQVINDLKTALPSLPATAILPTRPSQGAVYAMLARVYLSMADYTNALPNATAALAINNQLTDFNTLDQTSNFPFQHFVKDEYFHNVTIGDQMTGAYYAFMDTTLYKSFQTNDLRKVIYFKSSNGGYSFSGNYEPSPNNLFNGLAVDEMYLTRAECYARAGSTSLAMADLNTLLTTRWVTGTYVPLTASSAADALSQILVERRKELLMRCTRWTDLRRLNQDPTTAITLTRVINGKTYTLPPNDLRYTLLIPYAVLENSTIAQNPR